MCCAEVTLAVQLADRLQRYVAGDKAGFEQMVPYRCRQLVHPRHTHTCSRTNTGAWNTRTQPGSEEDGLWLFPFRR